MAEESAASGGLDFLKHKIGPLPVGVWGAIGLAVFLYFQRKQNAATGAGAPNQQKDPAGNVGAIDPATGYVYGSREDQASIAANNTGGGAATTGTGGSTTAGAYPNNAAWGRAAVNYLVGLGIDPTVASQAIQQYLASQNLEPAQQGNVNLAIQSLGPPPQLPLPSTQNPGPVNGPSASNPPTGVAMDTRNVGPTTLSVKWNSVANATGYTVATATKSDFTDATTTTAPANQTSLTVGNLQPGTLYFFRVQAMPASAGAGWGGPVSATTSASPVFGSGPAGAEAKTATTLANETVKAFVSRVYAADPRVNPVTGDQNRITAVADEVYKIGDNAKFLAPGIDTPQKPGIPITYY